VLKAITWSTAYSRDISQTVRNRMKVSIIQEVKYRRWIGIEISDRE